MSEKYTLEQIRDMLGDITPGQWTTGVAWSSFFVETGFDGTPEKRRSPDIIAEGAKRDDAEFIAAAPDIVRQLLARIEFLRRADADADNFAAYMDENKRLGDKVKALEAKIEANDKFEAETGRITAENYTTMARHIVELEAEVARLRGMAPISEKLSHGFNESWVDGNVSEVD